MGRVFVFSPVIYHAVLDLSLQETGGAILDFVRSCICFIVELNLAPKPL